MSSLFTRWLCLAAVLWLSPSFVAGQACHTPSLRGEDDVSLRASVGASFASYANPRGRGDFQSVHALFAFSHPWFFVDASLPFYRLTRDGTTARGLGDVAADLRLHAVRATELGITAGPELSLTLPTGDASRDLGMGHSMLMPGAFVRLDVAQLTVVVQLAYGVALSHGAHAMHGGAAPIVNPMNRSEIEHALGVAYAVHEVVRVTARVLGAVPVAVSDGAAREVAAAGVQLVWRAFDLSIEQHVPFVGSPFSSKTLLALSGQW